jgi:hypothetical protein
MGHETNPLPTEGVFYADGAINVVFVVENYGLSLEDVSQEIKFGNYTGTVAQMLADEDCPMRDRLHSAYQEKGIDGVVQVFEGAKIMDPEFSVEISDATLEREHAKQVQPAARPESIEEEDQQKDDPPDGGNYPPAAGISRERNLAEEEAIFRQGETEISEPDFDRGIDPAIGEVAKEQDISDDMQKEGHSEKYESRLIVEDTAEETVTALPVTRSIQANPTPPINEAIVSVLAPASAPQLEHLNSKENKQSQLPPIYKKAPKPHEPEEPSIEMPATIDVSRPGPLQSLTFFEEPIEINSLAEESILPEEPLVEVEPLDSITVETQEVAMEISTKEIVEFFESLPMAIEEENQLALEVSETLSRSEVIENENVQEAITDVIQVAENILLLEEIGAEETEVIESEQQLILACEKLLTELGISYEPEEVEQLAKLIVMARKIENQKREETTVDTVTKEEGMREFKPGNLDISNLFFSARKKLVPLRSLGKWALSGSLANVSV